jgi:predicted helicase
MNSFNQIYILDLHGSSKPKENCPDGCKDQNVFEIMKGVAIILAVKKPGLKQKVSHADCWGLREAKYEWLTRNQVKSTTWKRLTPKSPFHFFVPRDEKLLAAYQKYLNLPDVFPVNSVGVVTSRDEFAIADTADELKKRIRMFRDENLPDNVIRQAFGLGDTAAWKMKEARRKIREKTDWERQVVPILYRPFDRRWIFYDDLVIERMRKDIMRHMKEGNLSLCVGRAGHVVGRDKPWNLAFCADCMEDLNLFRRGGNVNFPLYIYPEEDLYNGSEKYEREVNIKPKILEALDAAYGKKFEPEDVFCYIYAILYSNVYRLKYAQFLKSDFPRIPFCADYRVFRSTAGLGKRLVELHLMKSEKLDKPVARFEGKGDNLVEKISYDEQKNLVYINAQQSFGPVAKQVWEYQIGGYQVMEKWLSYRKKQRPSLDEIRHYCRITTAIKETIRVQATIDAVYPEIEKDVLAIELPGKRVS